MDSALLCSPHPHVNQPDQKSKYPHRYCERPPKEFVFAKPSDINEDHTQPVERVDEKEKQQRNINRRVRVNFSRRADQTLRERQINFPRPATVNLHRDEEEKAD